jgi:hypothetical protein
MCREQYRGVEGVTEEGHAACALADHDIRAPAPPSTGFRYGIVLILDVYSVRNSHNHERVL